MVSVKIAQKIYHIINKLCGMPDSLHGTRPKITYKSTTYGLAESLIREPNFHWLFDITREKSTKRTALCIEMCIGRARFDSLYTFLTESESEMPFSVPNACLRIVWSVIQ